MTHVYCKYVQLRGALFKLFMSLEDENPFGCAISKDGHSLKEASEINFFGSPSDSIPISGPNAKIICVDPISPTPASTRPVRNSNREKLRHAILFHHDEDSQAMSNSEEIVPLPKEGKKRALAEPSTSKPSKETKRSKPSTKQPQKTNLVQTAKVLPASTAQVFLKKAVDKPSEDHVVVVPDSSQSSSTSGTAVSSLNKRGADAREDVLTIFKEIDINGQPGFECEICW